MFLSPPLLPRHFCRCLARHRWTLWELRERDRKFDLKWADSLYSMASLGTVEDFWETYSHVPTLGCVRVSLCDWCVWHLPWCVPSDLPMRRDPLGLEGCYVAVAFQWRLLLVASTPSLVGTA